MSGPRCCSCRRVLRDAVSVAAGAGPVCRKALGLEPPRRPTMPAATRRHASAGDGQLDLPIQLTLEEAQ